MTHMSDFLTSQPNSFAVLFKKLRLRANILSLRALVGLLADHDFLVEESTLSRWQNGTRTPRDRSLAIALIKVFAMRGALTSVQEANQLLRLANLIPLSDVEEQALALKNKKSDGFFFTTKARTRRHI